MKEPPKTRRCPVDSLQRCSERQNEVESGRRQAPRRSGLDRELRQQRLRRRQRHRRWRRLWLAEIALFIILACLGLSLRSELSRAPIGEALVSASVRRYAARLSVHAEAANIRPYLHVLLAMMEVESGGRAPDVLQSSESLGLKPNSLDAEASMKQACTLLADHLKLAVDLNCDFASVIQSYNYGPGFLYYVAKHGGRYTPALARAFASEQADGRKVEYNNPLAAPDYWRYDYGNMYYVPLVREHLRGADELFTPKP